MREFHRVMAAGLAAIVLLGPGGRPSLRADAIDDLLKVEEKAGRSKTDAQIELPEKAADAKKPAPAAAEKTVSPQEPALPEAPVVVPAEPPAEKPVAVEPVVPVPVVEPPPKEVSPPPPEAPVVVPAEPPAEKPVAVEPVVPVPVVAPPPVAPPPKDVTPAPPAADAKALERLQRLKTDAEGAKTIEAPPLVPDEIIRREEEARKQAAARKAAEKVVESKRTEVAAEKRKPRASEAAERKGTDDARFRILAEEVQRKEAELLKANQEITRLKEAATTASAPKTDTSRLTAKLQAQTAESQRKDTELQRANAEIAKLKADLAALATGQIGAASAKEEALVKEMQKKTREIQETKAEMARLRTDLSSIPPGRRSSPELVQKDQELQKARTEVERLKGVVVRIQDAYKHEVLILHYNKAALYRSQALYHKAEEEYLAALAINPQDAAVHYNLAILYDDDIRNSKKAREHYERFLELAPDDADAPKVREWLASLQ